MNCVVAVGPKLLNIVPVSLRRNLAGPKLA
jgi:hypothetical protein